MCYNLENEYAHLFISPLSEMNKSLFELYSKKLSEYTNFFIDHLPYELPYLLAASNSFQIARKRIMCFAQETMSWGGEFSHHSNYSPILPDGFPKFEINEYVKILKSLKYPQDIVKALMILYDERVNKEWGPVSDCLWRFYNSLRENLEKISPYKYGLIHNNIAKIANCNGNKVNGFGSELSINKEFMDIIVKEIEITKPDVLIFCVGNAKHYRELLSHISYDVANLAKGLSDTKLVTEMKDVMICGMPKKVICSYHPNRLNRKKQLTKVSNDIIALL